MNTNPALSQQPSLLFDFSTAPTALSGSASAGSSISLLSDDSMLPSLFSLPDYYDGGTDSTRVQMVQTASTQDYRTIWAENSDPDLGLPIGGLDLSGMDKISLVLSLPKIDRRLAGYGVENDNSGSTYRPRLFLGNNSNGSGAAGTSTVDYEYAKGQTIILTFRRSQFPSINWDLPILYVQLRHVGGVIGSDAYDPDIVIKGLYSEHIGVPLVSICVDDGHISTQWCIDEANIRGIPITLAIIPESLNPTGNRSNTPSTGGSDRLNWDQVRAAQSAGNEAAMHINIDAELDHAGWLQKVLTGIQMFSDNGLAWRGFVFHQGSYGSESLDTLETLGFKYARATRGVVNSLNGAAFSEPVPLTMLSSTIGVGSTIDSFLGFQTFNDKNKAVQGWLRMQGHIFLPSGSSTTLEIDYAVMEAILDQIESDVISGASKAVTLNQGAVEQGFSSDLTLNTRARSYIAITRRRLKGPPKKRIYPKTKRGYLR